MESTGTIGYSQVGYNQASRIWNLYYFFIASRAHSSARLEKRDILEIIHEDKHQVHFVVLSDPL